MGRTFALHYNCFRPFPAVSTTRITAAGTPSYMAPELLAEKPFSKAADTYSFGVLLWVRRTHCRHLCLALSTPAHVLSPPWQELLARRIPFAGWRAPDIRDAVIKGTRPDIGALPLDAPAALRDLIIACWAPAGPERPSASWGGGAVPLTLRLYPTTSPPRTGSHGRRRGAPRSRPASAAAHPQPRGAGGHRDCGHIRRYGGCVLALGGYAACVTSSRSPLQEEEAVVALQGAAQTARCLGGGAEGEGEGRPASTLSTPSLPSPCRRSPRVAPVPVGPRGGDRRRQWHEVVCFYRWGAGGLTRKEMQTLLTCCQCCLDFFPSPIIFWPEGFRVPHIRPLSSDLPISPAYMMHE